MKNLGRPIPGKVGRIGKKFDIKKRRQEDLEFSIFPNGRIRIDPAFLF